MVTHSETEVVRSIVDDTALDVTLDWNELHSSGDEVASNPSVTHEVYEEPKVPKETYAYYVPYDTDGFDSLKQNHSYMQNLFAATYDITRSSDIVGEHSLEVLHFARDQGIKTFAVLQNRENGEFNSDIAEMVLSSPSLRQELILNTYSLVSDNGYAGVNIDFEGLDPSYKELFTKFIQDLVHTLRPEGFEVIVSIYPMISYEQENRLAYDLEQLGDIVDKVQVMAHNQHGAWSGPGPQASYHWVEDVLEYTIEKMDSNKILLGLTAYAYDWNLDNHNTSSRPLKDLLWLSSVTNGIHTWDRESQSPYFNYIGSNGYAHSVWYENEISTQLKTQLALEYDLAGVTVWRIGYEEQEFWESVEAGLNPESQIGLKTDTSLDYIHIELSDNHEFNNSFVDAVHVSSGNVYESYLSVSSDMDIYRLESDFEGNIMVNLLSPEGRNYDISVYETENWSNWIAGSSNGAGQKDEMTFSVQADTAYYIVVRGGDDTDYGPEPYNLSLGQIIRDTNEPNQTFEQATPVHPGNTYESYLSYSTDRDVYTFTPEVEGKVTVNFASPEGKNYEVKIFETASWSYWVAGTTSDEEMTFPVKADTPYYIFILGQDETAYDPAPYTLTLGSIMQDTNEPNQTFEQATPVHPGNTYESYLSYSTDRDVYTFTPEVEGKVTVNFASPEGKNYEVKIFETASWSYWVAGTTSDEEMTFPVKADTSYYIFILGQDETAYDPAPYTLTLGPIMQDTNEPNQTFEQAVPVQPGNTYESYLSFSNDRDVYAFTPEVEGKVTVNFASPEGKNYEVKIFETASWSYWVAGTTSDEEMTFPVKADTSYYIFILGQDETAYDPAPYTLTLGPIMQDTNEPNQTFEQAVPVQPGNTYESYLSFSNDRDVYAFTPEVEGRITVTLQSPEGGNFDIEVFETANWSNWLTDSTNDAGEEDALTFLAQADTAYYIVVYGGDASQYGPSPYTLTLGPIMQDTNEPNQTFEQAVPVQPGNTYESYLSFSNDRDVYAFTPEVEGRITVTLQSPEGGNFDIEVFETANWSNWLTDSTNDAGEEDALTFLAQADTAYYIVVYGGDASQYGPSPYTLTLGPIMQDTNEPNQTFEQAVPVHPGNTYESYLSFSTDRDVYTFTPEVEGKVTVNFASPEGKNYEVKIFETASWSNWMAGTTDDEEMTFLVKTDTPYYIFILGQDETAYDPEPYSLSLGHLIQDTNEPNDTFEQAASVHPGNVYESYLSIANDRDVYTFIPSADGQVTVNFASPEGKNYEVKIFETASWSYWVAGTTDDEEMTFPVKADTPYYIFIIGQDETAYDSEPYSLSLGQIIHDTNEPNETFDQAVSVQSGNTYESYLSIANDRDVYTFTPDVEGQITVNFTPPEGRNYEVKIFETASWSYWVGGTIYGNKMTFNVKANTPYYIIVLGKDETEYGLDSYKLSVGNFAQYNYDSTTNQLKSIRYADGTEIRYFYDSNGNLETVEVLD